jgi:hypothetical protein
LRVKIYLPQNSLAIRNVCYRRWQIKLTGFSAESLSEVIEPVTHRGFYDVQSSLSRAKHILTATAPAIAVFLLS